MSCVEAFGAGGVVAEDEGQQRVAVGLGGVRKGGEGGWQNVTFWFWGEIAARCAGGGGGGGGGLRVTLGRRCR